jgi:hypothetical protein
MLADYFHVSVDTLITEDPKNQFNTTLGTKTYTIPKLNWHDLSQLAVIETLDFDNWPDWQSVSLDADQTISPRTFALESRPSMYRRYPKGTLFILDPETIPLDGDIVFIRLRDHGEYTLKELSIDPPTRTLLPLVEHATTVSFNEQEHDVMGVCLLTMLYTH